MLNRTLLALALLFWFPLGQAASQDDADLAADVKLLQVAGAATDGPGLLQYFRKQTLSEDQRRHIEELIEQLGAGSFPVREKATNQLIALGQAAVPALEQALQHADPEVVARVQRCLKAHKVPPAGELLAAAVRVLAARKPPETVEVLLAFLPDAGDCEVEDEIVRALAIVGVRDGKADPTLVKALTGPLPLRCAAVGAALARAGLPEHANVVRKLLQDPQPVVRLHVALALVFARETEAVTVLIDLLPQLPQGRALQVEDILYQLAEGHARPNVTLGNGEAGRKKCRDAWAAWWKGHAAKVDLARLQETPGGWVSLFNRKDLAGWKTHPNAPGNWRVEDGILIGRGPNISHLYTVRDDYEDFHFRIEAKINAGGNSGQQFRKQFGGKNYEAQIDSSSHKAKTGSLYITSSPAVGIYEVLVPVDTWFTQEVIVRGNHIVILVNGKKTVDFIDTKNTYVRGHLALELYDPPTVVQFRRIEVKELGWKPLFKGNDLTGWRGLPGHWTAKGRSLIGSTAPGGLPFNTFLCSERTFKDFELKFQVKLTGEVANSGVQIRSEVADANKLIVKGPQCDIGEHYWGSLYGELFGGMMKQAPKGEVGKVVKVGEFNDYFIRCAGKHVTIQLNGVALVDDDFPKLPDTGIIAWQLHSGPPMTVVFKNIEIKELLSVNNPQGN